MSPSVCNPLPGCQNRYELNEETDDQNERNHQVNIASDRRANANRCTVCPHKTNPDHHAARRKTRVSNDQPCDIETHHKNHLDSLSRLCDDKQDAENDTDNNGYDQQVDGGGRYPLPLGCQFEFDTLSSHSPLKVGH